MKLNESILKNLKENTEETNNYKQKFIDYCKGKVKKLGRKKYTIDPDSGYKPTFHIVMLGPDGEKWLVQEDSEGYVEFWDGDGMSLVSPPSGTEYEVVAQLKFSAIDKEVYEEVLEYWKDIDMDWLFKEVEKEEAKEE